MMEPLSSAAMSLVIRAIEPADAEAAAALSAELGYPVDAALMRKRIGQLGDADARRVFVACRDGQVVGWIDVSVVHHLQSGGYAEIGGLVVSERARSAGIGAALVARAEEWARHRGLTRVVVRSQIARDAAHRFYVREGYTRTKTSAVFSKSLG